MREHHHARNPLSGRKLLLSAFLVTLGVLLVSLTAIAFSAARSSAGLRGTDRAGKQRTGYVTEHQELPAQPAGTGDGNRCEACRALSPACMLWLAGRLRWQGCSLSAIAVSLRPGGPSWVFAPLFGTVPAGAGSC